MLTNTKEMLNKAKNEKYAIPHFNINNLEWSKYILEVCELMRSPVILGVSESTVKYIGGYNTIFSMINGLIKDLNISVSVSIHLDHGSSKESCINAIEAGFTSVMIDASKYDLDENIKITKQIVEYAKKKNVSVEAEIGAIISSNKKDIEIIYTNVNDATLLANKTGIDSIAPAVGSVHGIYTTEPKLDFIKIKEISKKTNLPLVLHGGSGIPNNLIKKAIENGICKININTELQIAWSNSLKKYIKENPNVYDPRKIIGSGKEALQNIVKEKILLFGSNNKY